MGEWANVDVRLNGVINKIARFDWPHTEYCKTNTINSLNLSSVSYPCVESKASKIFRTPYSYEIFNMFYTQEDDGPKCFIPSLRKPGNDSYPETKHSNRVCRLKNEPPLKQE